MRRRRSRVSVIVALSIFMIGFNGILLTGTAFAQMSGATLTGTVQDFSDAVIPNAEVSVTNLATGVNRKITTDTAGFYTMSNLLPGDYQVEDAKTFGTLNFGGSTATTVSFVVSTTEGS